MGDKSNVCIVHTAECQKAPEAISNSEQKIKPLIPMLDLSEGIKHAGRQAGRQLLS